MYIERHCPQNLLFNISVMGYSIRCCDFAVCNVSQKCLGIVNENICCECHTEIKLMYQINFCIDFELSRKYT